MAPALEPIPATARRAEALFRAALWVSGILALAIPAAIVGHVAVGGVAHLSREFLVEGPSGFPLGSGGGIGPAVAGSLALVALGLAVSVPPGVAAGVFLEEYAPRRRWVAGLRLAAESLASVPAIVFGLAGWAFLVVGLGLRTSLLSGGLTLGAMMLPIVVIGTQEALGAVAGRYRESALSLGVSRWWVVRRVLLPRALPGVLAAAVLAAGHAFGSAAPVLFTASVAFTRGAPSLDAPVMSLPTHLYYLVSEAVSFGHAYGTALVMVATLLLANGAALVVRERARGAAA
jgi:phosphate transport system permease protein